MGECITGNGTDQLSWTVSATPRIAGPAVPMKTQATARQQFAHGRVGDSLLTFTGRIRPAFVTVGVSSAGPLLMWLRPGCTSARVVEDDSFMLGEPRFS